jgi:tRNA dimethylallyltransferase
MQFKCDILVGATAVGKSAVAQCLAERRGSLILSADSMLVYRGMDIGTAKPTAAERGSVPYYGIDLADPSEKFSVWNYHQHALGVLSEHAERDGGVIVVGGTGLYVKSLTHGLEDRPGADAALRKEWELRVRDEGVRVLQEHVRSVAPEAYAALADNENPRRLLRVLESVGSLHERRRWSDPGDYVPPVALVMDNKLLHERIARRVEIMYAEGLVAEVERLLACELPMSDTARQAIGYTEAISYIEGNMTQAEAMERTIIRTRQLAKRQRTWFRNQTKAIGVEVFADSTVDNLADRVQEIWEKQGRKI